MLVDQGVDLKTLSFRASLTRSVKHCKLLEKTFPEEFPRNRKSVEQDSLA